MENINSSEYYKYLYIFQDEIIKIVGDNSNIFYLTGGTCLSRAYFHHRYSDDLDFFTNSNLNFEKEYQNIKNIAKKKYKYIEEISTLGYKKISISNDKQTLVLDFVNDINSHFGELVKDKELGKIDNVRNILSNKISALIGRTEAKDVIDLWIICKNYFFSFDEILQETENKEVNINVDFIIQMIKTMPKKEFDKINWIEKPDYYLFKNDIEKICNDMSKRAFNSLLEEVL